MPATATDPIQVIKNFLDAQNAAIKTKNIDAAMAFFADNAVYTTFAGAKYTDRVDIVSLFQHHADVNRQFAMSNAQVTGNKVTFQMQMFVSAPPRFDV